MKSNTQIRKIHIKKNIIRRYFYFGTLSAIILLVISLSSIYTQSLRQEYLIKIDQLSNSLINEKKRFIQNTVDRTIYFIQNEKRLVEQENASKKLSAAQVKTLYVERIRNYIRGLRLIDNGYVWVNHIVNYEGGDKYAVREIHPNLPHTESTWLSTNAKDIKGNRPYQAELDGVKEHGELYYEYYFKKMNSNKIAHKMSFAKLYKPLDWVVATGVYLDDVDQLIETESQKMQRTYKKQMNQTLFIALIAVFFSVVIMVLFERQIRKLILSHENDIENYTTSLFDAKEKAEKALSEVKQLKGMLPICSNCKKIRDDQGYWNQIEAYIKRYSGADFSHSICPECAKELYPDLFPKK